MTTNTITKSVRLTPAESNAVSQLSQDQEITESAIMKRWILDGIRKARIEKAVHAYMNREVDLRGGAAIAEVSYNRFVREIEKRNIVILEDDHFLDGLLFLAEAFDSPRLRRAVESLQSENVVYSELPKMRSAQGKEPLSLPNP